MSPNRAPPSLAAAVYEDWSLDQSLQFLKDQGIAVRDSANLGEVQKQVADNADAAAKVCQRLVASDLADMRYSGELQPLALHKATLRLFRTMSLTRMFCSALKLSGLTVFSDGPRAS